MLQNLLKAIGFNLYSHYCRFNLQCILRKGWLASLKGCEVSLQKLFHHVCLPNQAGILQLVDTQVDMRLLQGSFVTKESRH
jgi:hypothetical protein